MSKLTPFLWFNTNVEEVAKYYSSIFKNAKVEFASPGMASFELEGQQFMALNGGPQFKFTEAVSFFIHCVDQAEVDYYWEKLSSGGEAGQCGWLKDKYGLSWQVVPDAFNKLMAGGDPEKSQRVMEALLKMTKIEVETLQKAYDGTS
jgi:predicted 3-demethylubiquinone-9 3-methyltransferase (glyoxalase superfamily)